MRELLLVSASQRHSLAERRDRENRFIVTAVDGIPRVEASPTFIGPAALPQQRVALYLGLALTSALIFMPLRLGARAVPLAWLVDLPFVAFILLAVLVAALHLRKARVGVDGDEFYLVNAFGSRRSWALATLDSVIQAKILFGGIGYGPGGLIPFTGYLVVDREGRTVVSLAGPWQPEGLASVFKEARLHVHQPWHKPVGVEEIRRRYPGAFPGVPIVRNSPTTIRRQALVGVLGCAVLAVLVIVGFAVAVLVVAYQKSH
ncbi:MAG: hypothetical protein NVS9B11_00950 [Candidatus Dormibacteraceae bacterium]